MYNLGGQRCNRLEPARPGIHGRHVMASAAATFLWLKQRLFGSLQWYDAIPVLMILSLKPMEIYFSCPNVSHGPLPLLLLILLCIALTLNTMLLAMCLAVGNLFHHAVYRLRLPCRADPAGAADHRFRPRGTKQAMEAGLYPGRRTHLLPGCHRLLLP